MENVWLYHRYEPELYSLPEATIWGGVLKNEKK